MIKQMRQQILAQRRSISSQEKAELSQKIVSRFLAYSQLQEPEQKVRPLWVGMYRALEDEVDLAPLEFALRRLKAVIHFPRIVDVDTRAIEFVEVSAHSDPESFWKKGPYEIEEPHPHLQAVDCQKLNLIFVPGVAFGPLGQRVGRGAGFYDRFLPRVPHALRVALIFDFQLLDHVPQEPWDQPVHWIVTDQREVRTPFLANRLKKWERG